MSLDAAEESRAAAYRTQEANRRAYRKALAASLEGDPAALQELTDNWEPIIQFEREVRSNAYGQDTEEEREYGRRWAGRGPGEL